MHIFHGFMIRNGYGIENVQTPFYPRNQKLTHLNHQKTVWVSPGNTFGFSIKWRTRNDPARYHTWLNSMSNQKLDGVLKLLSLWPTNAALDGHVLKALGWWHSLVLHHHSERYANQKAPFWFSPDISALVILYKSGEHCKTIGSTCSGIHPRFIRNQLIKSLLSN